MDQEEANALPPAPAANDERTGSEDVVLPAAAALLSASFQLPTSAKFEFPFKLHLLLEDSTRRGTEHIVSWNHSGNGFKVHSRKAFEEEILPVYFSSPKYRSFTRQLNLYGFQVNRNYAWCLWAEVGCYWHPLFKRGEPELCLQMRRETIKSIKKNILMMPPHQQVTSSESSSMMSGGHQKDEPSTRRREVGGEGSISNSCGDSNDANQDSTAAAAAANEISTEDNSTMPPLTSTAEDFFFIGITNGEQQGLPKHENNNKEGFYSSLLLYSSLHQSDLVQHTGIPEQQLEGEYYNSSSHDEKALLLEYAIRANAFLEQNDHSKNNVIFQ